MTTRLLFALALCFGLVATGSQRNPCFVFERVDVSGTSVKVSQHRLADIPPENAAQVRKEIIALAQKLYEAGRAKGKDTLFPIPPELYDGIKEADASTGLSQVQLNEQGKVIGFVLAYQNRDGSVHLEKIGVDPNLQKQGLMSNMLHKTATRAAELRAPYVDLLVVKVNTDAHAAYEKVGFENVTPVEFRADPRYNAFQFAVRTRDLVAKTAPAFNQ